MRVQNARRSANCIILGPDLPTLTGRNEPMASMRKTAGMLAGGLRTQALNGYSHWTYMMRTRRIKRGSDIPSGYWDKFTKPKFDMVLMPQVSAAGD